MGKSNFKSFITIVFMKLFLLVSTLFLANIVTPFIACAQSLPVDAVYGPELEGYSYPYPIEYFEFKSQGVDMRMAYMDIRPKSENGTTIVLLHGKNFCAATWVGTAQFLVEHGYRVIAPDQIGFCKSTKPEKYQYTFQQLGVNTKALLDHLGVSHAVMMGHSTGGMLAIRYALMYPEKVKQLVLVNPVGLEDWKAKGIPYPTVDQWYQRELGTNAGRVRNYERSTYYVGQWREEFEAPVQMYAGMYQGPGREIVAWNSALIYDMIFTQPIFYELEQLKVPTLLLIGTKDTTAIAKDFAPTEIRPLLGNYSQLGKAAAKKIPQATLIEFDNLGHAPQIQDPIIFNTALLQGIEGSN
jgi:pimeloyl-ACP methyl ester carboxylesterase